jgi:hypothetical protein
MVVQDAAIRRRKMVNFEQRSRIVVEKDVAQRAVV